MLDSPSGMNKSDSNSSGFVRSLSVYLQPRLLFVFVMGFASGLPLALASATLFFWLAEAGVALAAIGLFALFTSFMAFGRTLLSASSGWMVELTGWFDFFLISTLVALPGLLLLLWMMRNLPMTVQSNRAGILEPQTRGGKA